VALREVTCGAGGYANVSLSIQLEATHQCHCCSRTVVTVWLRRQQWYWGADAKLSRLLCAAFFFFLPLESAAVSCIIAAWDAFERSCFPFPCLQVVRFFAADQAACEMLSVESPATEL